MKTNLLVVWENLLKLSADWAISIWTSNALKYDQVSQKKFQSLNFKRNPILYFCKLLSVLFLCTWEFLCRFFIESPTHTNSWMSGTIVFSAKLIFQGFRNCPINIHLWGIYKNNFMIYLILFLQYVFLPALMFNS